MEEIFVTGLTMIDDVENEPECEPCTMTTVSGIVRNCKKLNVRQSPSKTADVITTVSCNETLVIVLTESTNEWYRVCTVCGIEGYCMKDYVDLTPDEEW